MRKIVLAILIAAVTGALASGSAFATRKPQVFGLIAVNGPATALPPGSFDPNADGPIPLGGTFTFTDGLYRWAGTKRGRRAGHLDGTCTAIKLSIEARTETVTCQGTVFLPGGEIELAGEPDYSVRSHGFQLVVLGGTGGYAGVRGFVDVEDLRSGNSSFAFHLLR